MTMTCTHNTINRTNTGMWYCSSCGMALGSVDDPFNKLREVEAERAALEADNAALRQDAERLDWLDLQADDWTYKESKVWKIVGPKISIREAIDSVRPMRQDDAALLAGKEP